MDGKSLSPTEERVGEIRLPVMWWEVLAGVDVAVETPRLV